MRSSAARLLLSKGSKHEVGRQVCLCLQSLCNRQPPSPREMHPEWGEVQGLTLLLSSGCDLLVQEEIWQGPHLQAPQGQPEERISVA